MSYHQASARSRSSYDNWDWIVRGKLAQGAYPDPPSEAFEDFDVVVFCATELQPRLSAPLKQRTYYLPMKDDPYRPVDRQSAQKLNRCARELADRVRDGQVVLATCAAGMNRSGLVNALILMHLYGITGAEAVKKVQRRRSDDQGSALFNGMFTQFLECLPPME